MTQHVQYNTTKYLKNDISINIIESDDKVKIGKKTLRILRYEIISNCNNVFDLVFELKKTKTIKMIDCFGFCNTFGM